MAYGVGCGPVPSEPERESRGPSRKDERGPESAASAARTVTINPRRWSPYLNVTGTCKDFLEAEIPSPSDRDPGPRATLSGSRSSRWTALCPSASSMSCSTPSSASCAWARRRTSSTCSRSSTRPISRRSSPSSPTRTGSPRSRCSSSATASSRWKALSELGPEAGAKLLADRSAEEIVKLLQELPSDDAAAIIDYLPEDLSAAVLELMQKRPAGGDVGELLEYAEQTAGRIMNPKVFALAEDMTAGESITALQGSRDVEMVFYLYVDRRAPASRRRRLAAPPAARLARHAAEADHDDRPDQRARRHRPGRSRAPGRVLQPARHSGRRRGEQARRRHHRRRRHRRHQGRGDRGRLSPRRRAAGTTACSRGRPSRCASGCRGCWSTSSTAFIAASVVALFDRTIDAGVALAVFMPVVAGMGGNAATQTLTVIVRGIALGELTWAQLAKGAVQGSGGRHRQRRRLRARGAAWSCGC